jgi:hypothetical protein
MTLRMTLRLLPSPPGGELVAARCKDLNLGCTGEANGWIEGIHKLAKAVMSPNPSARREPGEPVPGPEENATWLHLFGGRLSGALGVRGRLGNVRHTTNLLAASLDMHGICDRSGLCRRE